MAAALLTRSGHSAGSAGLQAEPRAPANDGAIVEMERRGLDLHTHRARQLTPDLACAHDLVLCMERWQVDAVRELAPAATVRTLGEHAGIDEDVMDPYAGGPSAYEACAAQLEALVSRLDHPSEEPAT